MQQLFQGIVTYIQSWQTAAAIVAFIIAVAAWMTGHRFAAVIECLFALALIFTASTILGQFGL